MISFQRSQRSPEIDSEYEKIQACLEGCTTQAWKKRARLESRLAVLMSLNENLRNAAKSIQEQVVADSRTKGWLRLEATALIRLGIILQHCDQHEQAIQHFDSALALISKYRLKKLRDFAQQHKGKCLVELGEYEVAGHLFRAALSLRKRRGDHDLIESTRKAIEELREIIYQETLQQ